MKTLASGLGIQEIPVELIDVRPDLFQARETTGGKHYNEELVAGLVAQYDRNKLDPVEVYPSPDSPGRYILTAGHHRLELVRRVGEATIPGRIAQVDSTDPDALNRLRQEAVLSNFRSGRSSLRELVNTVGVLQDTGMDSTQIAARMRTHSRPEIERLLDLYRLGASSVDRINTQPELQKVGEELGRALRMYPDHFNQENTQALLLQFARELDETGQVRGHAALRQRLRDLAQTTAPAVEDGRLPGFAPDAIMAKVFTELDSLEEVNRELARLRNDRNACGRLSEASGVNIDTIQSYVDQRITEVEKRRDDLRNQVQGLGVSAAQGQAFPAPPPPPVPAPTQPPESSNSQDQVNLFGEAAMPPPPPVYDEFGYLVKDGEREPVPPADEAPTASMSGSDTVQAQVPAKADDGIFDTELNPIQPSSSELPIASYEQLAVSGPSRLEQARILAASFGGTIRADVTEAEITPEFLELLAEKAEEHERKQQAEAERLERLERERPANLARYQPVIEWAEGVWATGRPVTATVQVNAAMGRMKPKTFNLNPPGSDDPPPLRLGADGKPQILEGYTRGQPRYVALTDEYLMGGAGEQFRVGTGPTAAEKPAPASAAAETPESAPPTFAQQSNLGGDFYTNQMQAMELPAFDSGKPVEKMAAPQQFGAGQPTEPDSQAISYLTDAEVAAYTERAAGVQAISGIGSEAKTRKPAKSRSKKKGGRKRKQASTPDINITVVVADSDDCAVPTGSARGPKVSPPRPPKVGSGKKKAEQLDFLPPGLAAQLRSTPLRPNARGR